MADRLTGAPGSSQATPSRTELLARATSLEERLSSGCPGARPEDDESAEARLARWRNRAARDDPRDFERRLAWDGWDLAAARRCLTAAELAPAAVRSSWQQSWRQIEQHAPDPAAASQSSEGSEGCAVPFEEVFLAHREVARRRLEQELAAMGATGAAAADAWRDFDRGLAARLSSLAGEALIAAFDEFRGGPPHGLAVRLAEAGVRRETRRYRAFIAASARHGLLARWPALARLTATAVDQWVGTVAEMIGRLLEDGSRIVSAFFTAEPAAAVSLLGMAPGLSDPHHHGRTVHVLTLAPGRLVYKPRGLGAEEDFARLLAWCGERGLSLALRSPRLIDRGTHGWMELVSPAACGDEAAARRFHRRAGMLLGLLHAFGSRDCHCENLIACGEHPILVDLEAWLPVRLRQWPPAGGLGGAWREAARRLERSVLSTGLLPHWQQGGRGELRNVGALGGGRPGRYPQAVWRAVNTDAMVRLWSQAESPAQPNVPVLRGEALEPSAFLSEVAAGFSEMYDLLLRHRGELLGPQGPLGELAGRKTRLILRSTGAYRRLLERSLSPDCCRDGAARSIELEYLARVYLEADTRPAVWPLLAAERRALERADVPLFRVPVTGTIVEVPDGGCVDGALEMPSLAAIRQNLLALGEEDRRRQISFLRAALAPNLQIQAAPAGAARAEAGDGEQFLAAAGSIAQRLGDLAVRGADGSAAWIGPRYFPSGGICELAVLGPDLYGGTAGIALFLAAFGHATGDDRSKDLALRAIESLCRSLSRRMPPELGIGGLAGIASVLYALVWIGELLGEEPLIADALALSAHLDSRRIAADRDLDVVSGSAGAILALLALDRAMPAPNPAGRTALEIAGECADHLLARRCAAGPPPHGWRLRGEAPLAGFAHGAAGIGHALLRLYERTGRRALRDAAREGLAVDRQLSPAPAGEQRQRRRPLDASWCRGAPGIALARLTTLDVLDGAEVRQEIGLALEVTRTQPLSGIDHLCCGNLGRAEVLLEASRILGDPALLAAAREIARRALARAAEAGRFGCMPGGSTELTDPSLFRGEAGIGLCLLRLAGHEDLPCLLRLSDDGLKPAAAA